MLRNSALYHVLLTLISSSSSLSLLILILNTPTEWPSAPSGTKKHCDDDDDTPTEPLDFQAKQKFISSLNELFGHTFHTSQTIYCSKKYVQRSRLTCFTLSLISSSLKDTTVSFCPAVGIGIV